MPDVKPKLVTNGTPHWIDLSTVDVAAAQQFYGALLGWTFDAITTPFGDHHIASNSGVEIAGMMALSQELADGPSFWTVFFDVDDVDRVAAKVEAGGGHLMHPTMDLPDGTRIIAVTDPAGAMFGLMSHQAGERDYLSQNPGAVGWVELMTRTPNESNKFYADIFGYQATAEPTDSGVLYTVYSLGEDQVAGMIATPPELPSDVPDNWSVYFSVADCAATEAKAVELGGSVLVPTTPTPIGPFAVLADPQGAVFQLMEFAVAA